MRRKFLALLLSCAMVMSSTPMPAFAEADDADDAIVTSASENTDIEVSTIDEGVETEAEAEAEPESEATSADADDSENDALITTSDDETSTCCATLTVPEHCTVYVYDTQDVTSNDATLTITSDTCASDIAYARNGDTGELDTEGTGQINFVVVPDNGYVIDSVAAEGSYNKLKVIDETSGIYRLTQVSGTVAVTVSVKEGEAETAEMITFSDDGITPTEDTTGYTIDGTELTITTAGTYYVTGSCTEGNIKVKKGTTGVNLVLTDLTLACSTTAPVAINKSCGNTTLTIEGTVALTDNEDASTEDTNSDFEGACVKIKEGSNLTIVGAGKLTAEATQCKNAIKGGTTVAVVIKDSVTIVANAANNGIASDGSVTIEGGTIDVTSASDGIKSSPDEDDTTSAGTVTIKGGTVTVSATGDAIQAANDLSVTGGTVTVTNAGDEGLVSEGTLTISGGALNVTSTSDAIRSAGKLVVSGGSLTLSSGSDALQTATNLAISGGNVTVTKAGDEGVVAEGTITITGGALKVSSTSDAIRATGNIVIKSGTITLVTNNDGIQSDANVTISGGTFNIKTKSGYTTSQYSGSDSAKGIKARYDDDDSTASTSATNVLTITGGTFTLNTADDALHSDNNIVITGGNLSIKTGDDAAHADTTLKLGKSGKANCSLQMDVDYCYEGLEAGTVYVYSGCYDIYGIDDGINSAGGSDETTTGGFNPFPGWGMNSSAKYPIYISGGLIKIGVKGDGIDANGNLTISGGTIISFGGGGSENGIDSDGTFKLTGGTVFAAGSNSPMAATPSSGSQAYKGWTRITSAVSKGSTVNLTVGGSKVVSIAAPYAEGTSSYWFYSSPSLSSSSSATWSTGGTATGIPATWASHSWSTSPTWSWSSDYGTATAKFTCTACGTTTTVSASVSSSTSGSVTTYTAKVSFNGKTYTTTAKTSSRWERLYGSTRYDTMAAIVNEGFESSEWAVIATGENFPDALVASSIAGSLSCPVVLTSSSTLSAQAADELESLGVTKAYVMGGSGAISDAVYTEIEAMGITCERICGDTRQGTSLDAMSKLSDYDTIVVATGKNFADALSISPWCYESGAPILLTQNDGTLTVDELAAITESGAKSIVIVGGTSVVVESTEEELESLGLTVERLSGTDRYATSAAIATWELKQGMGLSHVSVSTGTNFPDALAGAALCGTNGSVLLLAASGKTAAIDAVLTASAASQVELGYVLGGTAAVPAGLATYLVGITG